MVFNRSRDLDLFLNVQQVGENPSLPHQEMLSPVRRGFLFSLVDKSREFCKDKTENVIRNMTAKVFQYLRKSMTSFLQAHRGHSSHPGGRTRTLCAGDVINLFHWEGVRIGWIVKLIVVNVVMST